MRAKVVLGMAVGLLVLVLGAGLVTRHLLAQPSPWPLLGWPVAFAEDPLRQHGLQVVSYYAVVSAGTWTLFGTVPPGKRLIITDISTGGSITNSIAVAADSAGNDTRGTVATDGHEGWQSGIMFQPSENIYVIQDNDNDWGQGITLSGYYVDL
ncbi:MAG: hypothetical protein AB1486_28845 [Planctomycetota bacterium]